MTMRFLARFWPIRLGRSRSGPKALVEQATEVATRVAGLPNFRQSLPDLARELARARRYGRPTSLTILSLGGHWSDETRYRGSVSAADSELMTPTSLVATIVFGSVLQEALRESDIVTYVVAHNKYAILLTESTKAQAQRAIERLAALYHQRTLNHLRAGIAEFPVDALTLEELIASAQKAWEEQSVGQNSTEPKEMLNDHRVGSHGQTTSATIE
jgi:hypothetical protein